MADLPDDQDQLEQYADTVKAVSKTLKTVDRWRYPRAKRERAERRDTEAFKMKVELLVAVELLCPWAASAA